ncbi:hypothetical protein BT96DRAFT_997617 [Gymnopus androsaceus JB14]|uniref:Uncharacterized protein n=1 Tax=Gymnopus androsaceus JB14 TaxID=1447944 RepID=A0A6A4HCY0_9AGAR|nr:hypothetical protein BT96DRAFT_997617 [Gymnopus androsaceus JB14]
MTSSASFIAVTGAGAVGAAVPALPPLPKRNKGECMMIPVPKQQPAVNMMKRWFHYFSALSPKSSATATTGPTTVHAFMSITTPMTTTATPSTTVVSEPHLTFFRYPIQDPRHLKLLLPLIWVLDLHISRDVQPLMKKRRGRDSFEEGVNVKEDIGGTTEMPEGDGDGDGVN